MTTQDYREKSPLMIFLSYFKNHRWLFAADVTCAVGIAAIDLLFPLVTRSALYEMLPNQMYRTFFTIMVIVAVCYVLRSFLNYVVAYYGHTFGIRVEADIRRDLFRHMQELSVDFYDRNRTGKLMARLTSDLFELTELAHHGPEDLITSVLTILGALIVMASIRWQLAVIVALTIPVFLTVAMAMRGRMGRASAAAKEKIGHINQEIESSLSGVRTAKAFANETVEAARFDAANAEFKTSKRAFHKAMGMFHSSVEFFLCSLNVIIIGFGGYYVMQGEMDYRDLLTFSLYISSFINPMRKLANFSETFANGFAGLNRFVEVMRTEPTVQDKPNARELKNVRGEIRVDHVSFAYENGNPILNDVSFSIPQGSMTAIVGPSGSGKTTITRLIARFWDIQDGSITVGGHDVKEFTCDSLLKNMSMVFQNVYLFHDTIENNIKFGCPDATHEQVVEAAKKACCHDFISALPQGYDTVIGEGGSTLSGGEKQRISIARAMLKDAPIILLDEATASVDPENEVHLQQAISALVKNKTLIVIAHRLSTIRDADQILVVDNGKIVEKGVHAELIQQKGIYQKFWNIRQKARNWKLAQ